MRFEVNANDEMLRQQALGIIDKHDEGTYAHCFRIARSVRRLSLRHSILGLLHDSLEDGILPVQTLHRFPLWLRQGIVHLTRYDGELYAGYIRRVSNLSLARDVKIADLFDNLFNRPHPPKMSLMKRYVDALHTLRLDKMASR